MLEGQKILSPTRLINEGMKVSAATRAMRMPIASMIPMDLTMENEQIESAPNPMMTARPDVNTDSPAHWMEVLRASSCDAPSLLSSLYLDMMNNA